MSLEYRLVSIYYNPEFTRYVLQHRVNFWSGVWRPRVVSGPWMTLPTIDARELPDDEKRELAGR